MNNKRLVMGDEKIIPSMMTHFDFNTFGDLKRMCRRHARAENHQTFVSDGDSLYESNRNEVYLSD